MNNLLTEAIVLLTIGWATTALGTQQRRQRQRQAWQWWHHRQTLQAQAQAEVIRDDLLQQTFSLRRYLETSQENSSPSTTQPDTTHPQQWIKRIQTFHQSLEGLSNDLSPPFISDSLPLALQFAIKTWQQQQQPTLPSANLQLTLPAQWPESSPQLSQTILSTTTELLSILSQQAQPHRLQIELLSSPVNTLIVKFHHASNQTMPKVSKLIEIQYLKEVFHDLSTGQLELSQSNNTVTSQLQWPSTTP